MTISVGTASGLPPLGGEDVYPLSRCNPLKVFFQIKEAVGATEIRCGVNPSHRYRNASPNAFNVVSVVAPTHGGDATASKHVECHIGANSPASSYDADAFWVYDLNKIQVVMRMCNANNGAEQNVGIFQYGGTTSQTPYIRLAGSVANGGRVYLSSDGEATSDVADLTGGQVSDFMQVGIIDHVNERLKGMRMDADGTFHETAWVPFSNYSKSQLIYDMEDFMQIDDGTGDLYGLAILEFDALPSDLEVGIQWNMENWANNDKVMFPNWNHL